MFFKQSIGCCIIPMINVKELSSLIVFINCRELLLDFYVSSGKRKPDNIIIFR